jgi:pseudoazurin
MTGKIRKGRICLLLLLTLLAPAATTAETHVIRIRDHTDTQSMLFEPFFQKVELGDTVVFRSDSPGHVTRSVFGPEGGVEWEGKAGDTVTVTLDREGVYIYECVFHGRLGMAGVIQAGRASNLEEVRRFYREYRQKFVVYRDRLDPIIEALRP